MSDDPRRPFLRRYTLQELLVGMSPKAMREAFGWGPDVGREVVEYEPRSERDSSDQ
jgi:hypothetical protein